jgi:transposase
MKKIYVGIDISKEKCNLCYRKGLNVVLEEECANDVKALKKGFKEALKALESNIDEVLVCAEYTGRYIYPLTIACQELDMFLWIDDPTRIKNSMGIVRSKNDRMDASRIAEYALRYCDKAVRYAIPDEALVSMKSLLSDREFLLTDRKRYQVQLSDQKKYMAPGDYKHKSLRWKKVIRAIDEQITAIDSEIESLIAADPVLSRQKELLTSIDGVGERIAINMIAITGGFTRFRNARQFCSFAGLTPYKYDSGTSVRSKAKISKRANQTMKALLHMAAVGVATHMKEGEYKAYFERKTKEGKHVMCVLNVVRAKLVHRMFSVIQRNEVYTKQYNPASCQLP